MSLPKVVCDYEEEEAKQMDVDLKLNSFLEGCAELEDLVMEMYEIRKNLNTTDEVIIQIKYK